MIKKNNYCFIDKYKLQYSEGEDYNFFQIVNSNHNPKYEFLYTEIL